MSTGTDSIIKTTVLKAPRTRVWKAISDSAQFGAWFGCALDAPFVAGTRVTGRIAPTKVDREIAKLQEPHSGKPMTLDVERVEPESVLAFRWQPGVDALAQGVDTLVTFELADAPGGTKLVITESGFDRIPLEQRAKIFAGNSDGWDAQLVLIAKYLAGGAQ